jgi:hypothetical protein
MTQLLPPWIPERVLLVYLDGSLRVRNRRWFLYTKVQAIYGVGCRPNAHIVFSGKRLRCTQPYLDRRPRLGSGLSSYKGSASGRHLTLDLLVRDQATYRKGKEIASVFRKEERVLPNAMVFNQ